MGFLKFFGKERKPGTLTRIPTGSFTVDPDGQILVSTLPRTFPAELVKTMTRTVLSTLRSAREARMPLTELSIEYGGAKLRARELRGGAIIFISPRELSPRGRPV